MPETNIKMSMNEYKRLIAEDAQKAIKDSIYGKLLENLKDLTDMTQQYFENSAGGKQPILTPEDYKKLIDSYTALYKSCSEFLADDKNKTRMEKKRINIIKHLNTCIKKDVKELVNADKTKELTLSDVVKNARTKVVDLGVKELKTEGGVLSNRIPLSTSTGVKGFFTKKEVFSFKDICRDELEKHKTAFPQKFQEALSEFEFSDKNIRFLVKDQKLEFPYKESVLGNTDSPNYSKLYFTLAKFLNNLNPKSSINEIEEMLESDIQFAEAAFNIVKTITGNMVKYIVNESACISDGARVDSKNSAMSDVAALMGMSSVLAKAIPMKIKVNGEEIEGTFMESVEGDDFDRSDKNSLLMQSDMESFNHPEGLRKIADLQILDYICGNIDRHFGNMLYQFEKQDGKVVLKGITGIDNDASFGVSNFEEIETPGVRLTALNDISVISQSCYETLKNISANTLKITLADKLRPEEVESACNRLSMLQNKIDLEKITIVPDNQWGKGEYTINKLGEKSGGIFTVVSDCIESIEAKKELFETNKAEVKGEVKYAEGEELTDTIQHRFKEIHSKITQFGQTAQKLKKLLHVNSKEYEQMERKMKELLNYSNGLNDKLTKGETISEGEFDALAKKSSAMSDASQKYMDAKELSQSTTFGQNRFAFAKEMRSFTQESFSAQEIAGKEDVEPKEMEQPEDEIEL